MSAKFLKIPKTNLKFENLVETPLSKPFPSLTLS